MRCFFCGTELTTAPAARSPRRASVDHLIPTSRGGPNHEGNKVRACQACNRDKGNLTLEEYRVVLAYRRGMLHVQTEPNSCGTPFVEFWGERQKREREEKNDDAVAD